MNKYQGRQTVANASFLSTFITTTKDGKKRPSIRFYRYFTMILIHLLFVLSFVADIQVIEGDVSEKALEKYDYLGKVIKLMNSE